MAVKTWFDATFTRNSIAITPSSTAPVRVGRNVPRYEDGKYKKGILMEPITQNLLVNASFDFDAAGGVALGWSSFVSGVTAGFNVTNLVHRTSSAKSQNIQLTSGAGTATVKQTITGIIAGSYYTFSGFYSGSYTGTGRGYFRATWRGSGGSQVGSYASSGLIPSSEWTRYATYLQAPAGATQCDVEFGCVRSSSGDQISIFWDDVQVEQGSTVSTPIYAVDQSTRAIRGSEAISIPLPASFSWTNFRIDLSVNITTHVASAAMNTLWECRIDSGNFARLYVDVNRRLQFNICGQGSAATIADSEVLNLYSFYTITAQTIPGGRMQLFKNGVQVTGQPMYVSPVGAPTAVYFGCDAIGGYQLNGIIDEIRIGRSAVYDTLVSTPAEIAAEYNRGKPLCFTALTDMLMPCDGNLNVYTSRLTVVNNDQGAWVLQPLGAVVLKESDITVSPGWNRYEETLPHYHGKLDFGGVREEQEFNFNVRASVNRDLLGVIRRQIRQGLSPALGWQELIFEDDPDYCYIGKVSKGGISVVLQPDGGYKAKIPITCLPFMQSLETFWFWGSGYLTLNSAADVEIPCLITFYDDCLSPSVTINGVTVTYIGSLINGEKLEIDTGAMTATKVAVDGTRTNVTGNMNGNWPLLSPSKVNTVGTLFFCSLQYKDRW